MKESQRKPLNPLETTAFIAYAVINGTRLGRRPTLEDLKDSNFRLGARKLVRSVAANEQGTLYFPREAAKYANHPVNIDGEKNIPTNGPMILLINHYNMGPDNGMWTYSTVSKAVADNTNQGWNKRYRFIIKPEYEVALGKNALANKLRTKIIKPIATHILQNTGEAADAIMANGNGLEIRRTIKDGDVLATFPSAIDSFELQKGKAEVAGLIKLGLRMSVPIIPVGTYHAGTHLYVNFGRPITKADVAWARNDQETVDKAMIRIAQLLPTAMHGDYAAKD